jgi:peroxiredoxin
MDSLTKELNAFMNSLMDRVDPQTGAIIRDSQARLAETGIADRAIKPGDLAPDFTLLDQHDKTFSLADALTLGPVVVLFVRGGWCPFCAITLRAFDRVRAALAREGASLVAISPATSQNVKVSADREFLQYQLLADVALEVAKSFGLVWEPELALQKVYARLGHDLPRINGTGDWRLPIPAGYVIGQDGTVLAARVSTSLISRMLPSEALAGVKSAAQGL